MTVHTHAKQWIVQSQYDKVWRDVGEDFTYYTLPNAREGKKNLAGYQKNHHQPKPLRIVERLTIVFQEVVK